MKALVGAFNQEKALVRAFSVSVQPVVEPMDRFTALVWCGIMSGVCATAAAPQLAGVTSGRVRFRDVPGNVGTAPPAALLL